MAAAVEDLSHMAEAQQNFTLDLYKKACQSHPNFVFYPTSIFATLAMLGAGAQSDTAAQIAQALTQDSVHAKSEVHEVTKRFIASVTYESPDPTNVDMVVTNAFFMPVGVTVKEEFTKVLVEKYGVFIQNADFRNKRDEAANSMNSWIGQQTKNKILNVTAPTMFNDSTSLVLINAVYVKGEWERKFNRDNTNPASFRLLDGSVRLVNMMYQDGKFRYGYSDVLNCRVLEMPYRGGEFSMCIILPDSSEAFKTFEENITVDKIETILKSLGKRKSIMVWLPRFQAEVTSALNEVLPNLGINDMFIREKANFSGISEAKLFVSTMLHKMVIVVDEEGSDASGANLAVVTLMSLEISEEFRVNRPFIYVVRHNRSGAIVVIGRLTSPERLDV